MYFCSALTAVLIAVMATEKMNWELCVLCQEQSAEELVCTLDNPVTALREESFRDIISLVRQFKEFDAVPHQNVELPDEETMRTNRASWTRAMLWRRLARRN